LIKETVLGRKITHFMRMESSRQKEQNNLQGSIYPSAATANSLAKYDKDESP
jgi:hypothetical protein